MVLTKEGFRSEHPSADTFRFPQPLSQWKPTSTTEWSQTVYAGEFAGSPSKLRQDLTSFGFSGYFGKGLRLTLRCTTGPILTWNEGSMEANTDYATPASPWVLVSFRDRQPPILFIFSDKPGGLRLKGKSGEWILTSEGDLGSWVRILAPLGNKPYPTNSASDLGKLAKACQEAIDLAVQAPPTPVGFSALDEGSTVLGQWSFDRPGAVVPYPVFLSTMGGYGLATTTKVRRLDMNTSIGPTFVTDEESLGVRFPVRRVPTGRAVCLGPVTADALSTASYLDVNSVVELALGNLLASQEKASRELAEATVAEFLTETAYTVEPNTGQRLPYDGPGNGLDLTAANAMLFQSTISTARATSEPNSLLTSLSWRRDWLTWTFMSADAKHRRRACALAAFAYALAPEAERRVEAGMFHAGLCAERGLGLWLQRTQGAGAPPKLVETLFDLREDIFGKDDYRRQPGFGRSIVSEVRLFGDSSVTLIERDGKKWLTWRATSLNPTFITLASGYPITLTAGKNVADLQSNQGLGLTILKALPKAVGICEAELTIPEWADPLPKWLPPPLFSETER